MASVGRVRRASVEPPRAPRRGPLVGRIWRGYRRNFLSADLSAARIRWACMKEASMNLFVWLPAMFVLGLVSMGVCLAFAIGCEHI